MRHFKSLLPFMLLLPVLVDAQTLPRENSWLNHRIVGFSFAGGNGPCSYTIEIAMGKFDQADSFKEHICQRLKSSGTRAVGEVPQFGKTYTWRVVCRCAKQKATQSELHHFFVASIPEVDTNLFRLNITEEAKQYRDAYVFADGSRALYDMNGNPVWFLPYVEGRRSLPRDLRLSPKGTITCIIDDAAYELNFDGEVLWKAPNTGVVGGDTTERYHHEFTRLKNGHYMILGSERAFVKLPSAKDSSMRFITFDKMTRENKGSIFQSVMLGTVIEYDDQGSVVWSWKSSDYFTKTKIDFTGNANGSKAPNMDIHQNAFYFDEKNNYVFVSFKNINRLLKITYPGATVMNDYAGQFKTTTTKKTVDLFCGQHCCGISQRGYLYTFNNNECNPANPCSIVMMQQPIPGRSKLRKVWEYVCPPDNNPNASQMLARVSTGGNVVELPDQNVFASTSVGNCSMFIVNQQKEILWSATLEQWSEGDKKWNYLPCYKASMIFNHANLEHLIWEEEIK